jgi:hypothetical protein
LDYEFSLSSRERHVLCFGFNSSDNKSVEYNLKFNGESDYCRGSTTISGIIELNGKWQEYPLDEDYECE